MKQPLFTGACTALVTPFWENSINYPMLQRLIERQIAAGISAIVLAGTTGEASTLSDQEKIQLIEAGKAYSAGRCLILAGTGSNNTEHTISLSLAAQRAGADALLIVSPYYNKATPEGLYAHYSAVAQKVSIPIVIYNVPSRTAVDIPVAVYQKLSQLPNIIGVKECTTDLSKITRIRSQCPKDFQIWTGNDELTVPAISLGCSGVISVSANICPSAIVAMCNAALQGDFKVAADIQTKMQKLNELLFCEVNPIPAKAAMKMIGFDCGPCRLPLTDPSGEHLRMLREFFS